MFLKYKNNRFFTLHFSLFTFHLLFIFCFSGCTTVKKIQHLSQLLTIKHYSDAQDQITKDVEAENKMFDEMVALIEEDVFAYDTAEKIFERFGEPVYSRNRKYQGRRTEQWLYRYAKDFKGTNGKVYMYFDEKGDLVNLEYVGAR